MEEKQLANRENSLPLDVSWLDFVGLIAFNFKVTDKDNWGKTVSLKMFCFKAGSLSKN